MHRTRFVRATLLGTALGFGVACHTGRVRPPRVDAARPIAADRTLAFEPVQNAFVTGPGSARARVARTGVHITARERASRSIAFTGASPSGSMEPVIPLPGYSNYLIGNDPSKWRTHVPTYARVRGRNIYPGIDVEFYGTERQLEYDFVIHPGADPQSIRLTIDAPSAATISQSGDLVVSSDLTVIQRAPVAYQLENGQRRAVDARYVADDDGTFRITVGRYEVAQTLVIDPVVAYSFTYAGNRDDTPNAIAIGPDGASYVAGSTGSTDLPVVDPIDPVNTTGLCGPLNNPERPPWPCTDGFVLKLAPDGSTVQFATYFGGTADDNFFDVAVDPAGSVYLAGNSTSPGLPPDAPSTCGDFWTNPCAFVMKLTADGSAVAFLKSAPEVHSISVASDGVLFVSASHAVSRLSETEPLTVLHQFSASDLPGRLGIGPSGDVYVAGTTTDPNFPTTPGAFQASLGDRMLWRVSTTGARVPLGDPLPGLVPNAGWPASLVFAHPAHPGLLFLSVDGSRPYFPDGLKTQRSTDGGLTWSAPVPSGWPDGVMPDPRDMVADLGNGAVLYGPAIPGLLRSETAGETWEVLPVPGSPSNGLFGLMVAKATGVVYANTREGFFKSTDRGSSWQAMTRLTGQLLAVDSSNPPRIYVATSSGVRRTADEGVSFESLPRTPIEIDPSNPHTMYAFGSQPNGSALLKSVDDGYTYETISFGPYAPVEPLRIQVHPTSSNTLAVYGTCCGHYRGVLRSDDGGQTWSVVDDSGGTPGNWVSSAGKFPAFAFDAGDPSVMYVAKTSTFDAFVMRLSSTGEVRYSTLLGGWSNDGRTHPNAPEDAVDVLRVDPDGAVWIFGATSSADFPFTVTPNQSGGAHDFIARISSDGTALDLARAIGPQLPPGFYTWASMVENLYTVRCYTGSVTPCKAARFALTGEPLGGPVDAPWRADRQPLAVAANGQERLASWVRNSSGNIDVRVIALDWATLTSLQPNTSLPVRFNTPVTWAATFTPAAVMEYTFWRYDGPSGWSNVRGYAPDPTYSWTPAYGDIGDHTLQVWARPVGSTDVYETYVSTSFAITDGALPTLTALNASGPPPRRAGATTTWTATITGGAGPVHFKFYRRDADGWHLVQDYGPSNAYTWTPAATDVGAHDLQVWVRNADSLATYESYLGTAFTVDEPAPISVSLGTDRMFPAHVGQPIGFSGQATGGIGPLQYRFYRLDGDGWHLAQDYSAVNSYEWTPPADATGDHAVQVWVRSAGSSAIYEAWAGTPTFAVVIDPISTPTLSVDVVFPVPAGTPTTWTVSASGGIGPLQYQFWIWREGLGWTMAQDYSASNTLRWTPPADGTYDVQAFIRNAGSTRVYDAYADSGRFSVQNGTAAR
jgi:hypothetical protein